MSEHKTIKKIYSFTVNKEVEADEVTVSKNENGEEVKTIVKVKKLEPQKFTIKKPTREIREDAELFYNTVFAEGVKAGLLTYALLSKRYSNDGGAFSELDKTQYAELYKKLFDLESQTQKLAENKEQTDADKENISNIKKEMVLLQNKIRTFEMEHQSLFNNTAESRARRKQNVWFTLFLSFNEDSNGNLTPFFGEGKYIDKINKYDEIEEGSDDFLRKVLLRFVYFVSFYIENNNLTENDYKDLEKLLLDEENNLLKK